MQINISILDQLFPFYFISSENGELIHLGPSMKKLISTKNSFLQFEKIFQIVKPNDSSFSVIYKKQASEMIVLEMVSSKARLMGQAISLLESNCKLFIVNLVIQNADELIALKLNFNDFAVQDPIFDFLMLLQAQHRSIRQADELNKKLADAHKIAVKASEAKSQFLANMSHELRTPMNGLLGMASILQNTNMTAEQQGYIQILITSGEAMLSLVNDILDLSKIEAGFIHLELSTTDIDELLLDIYNVVLPLAQRKQLYLEFLADTAVPKSITIDRLRLRQIILNLVGNAIKFTSNGFVKVKIDVIESPVKNICLRITVTDSGIGMSEEVLALLFLPFVQGDSSMTKKFEGTGLGLSICKKIVTAMGGEISVSSVEGKGSEFIVTLSISHEKILSPRLEVLKLSSV
jgi:signal transduction histidine kinase